MQRGRMSGSKPSLPMKTVTPYHEGKEPFSMSPLLRSVVDLQGETQGISTVHGTTGRKNISFTTNLKFPAIQRNCFCESQIIYVIYINITFHLLSSKINIYGPPMLSTMLTTERVHFHMGPTQGWHWWIKRSRGPNI